ncbi:MAG: helicase-exonuclease AddAB subunit AddB [Lachnospiraceae bacterium]|nr:helicase-exonuclease AddAB subunit AddB [Lachnospiraceae bacterium]
MSLQFILGGSGCGKTYYAQHFISQEAAYFPQRQYIFLVPEQFTMQTQKELISISESKGIMNIDVQSFVRLAFRVFEETGAGNLPVLDDMGKTMVLKKVLTQMEGELDYFGRNIHKAGYVQEIKSFLSELYQYGVDEETLSEMIASAKRQPLLVRKLQDMQKIYRGFSDYLEEHFITSEEVLTVLAGVTEESGILRDSVVCLDGFTGFTPTQYQFIERLLPIARKVYVTVTIDKGVSIVKPGAKHGLFYMSQQTIYQLRKMAQAHGIEVCSEIWTGETPQETRFFEAPGICQLERGLFRYPMEEYGEEPHDISLHIMRQPEQEVEFVAEQIRGLLLEGEARYRDIAVITGDLGVYGALAGEILERAQIPYFVDQKKGIEEHPFVELIQQTIDIFLSNFQTEKVMAFEKNVFSHVTLEQGDLLENFLRATGIRGYKKWQEMWKTENVFYLGRNGGDSEKAGKERQQEIHLMLDTARQETLDQLGELYEAVGRGRHSVREYATAFCEWMEGEKYFEKIMRLAEEFGAQGERTLQWEYQQLYGIVLGVFDRLVELLGEEEMDLREFQEILTTGFSEARVGLIPPGVDQVVIGDMNRTRLAHVKYLFFLGMNDGNIPASGGGGGVISDSERLFLAEEEYELAPTLREKIYTEQFYLYLNLTKPSRHLYLTYCETGNDGKGRNPAYIIDRIRHMYPKLVPVVEENRQDDSFLLGNSQGADYLIRGLRDRNFRGEKWREIYRYYREDDSRRNKVDRLVDAAFYREEKTMLSKEVARALYQEILTGSTSQFEQYAACAFAYFMRYGLKLRERQEHQVAFFDIGNIVHRALELYTRDMISRGEDWGDISEEEQKSRGDQCVLRAVEEYRNDLLHHTERDAYLITRLQRILGRTIWAITKQMERGQFATVESEISFEAMHRTKGEGEEGGLLRLVGKIDRTDQMEEGDRSYIKIVDYKTGKKNLSLSDLYYGLQMQLLVYLKAGVDQERRDGRGKKLVIPAGVLYYHIDDPMVEGKGEKEDIERQILRELRMDGLLNEDDPILPSMDDALAGEQGLAANASSVIMPIATNKDGSLKKASKAVTTADFEDLMTFTEEKLRTIRDEIMAGHAEVNPYRKMDSSGENACAYCAFRGICRFDGKLPGNEYRMIEKLSDDDAMRKIRDEIKREETQ